MIQKRAKSLVQLINKKRILRSEKDNIQAYKTRKDQLQVEVQKVVSLIQKVALMWKHKICENKFEDKFESLIGLVSRLQKDFKENPECIKKQGVLSPLSSKVQAISLSIEEELYIKWRDYVEKDLPIINQDLLNILEKIPSFTKKVRSIKILNTEVMQYKERLVTNERELLVVFDKKQQLINEWNSLGADDVPTDVLVFLRVSATTKGADLNLLTPKILDWLQNNKIQSFFKIHLQ